MIFDARHRQGPLPAGVKLPLKEHRCDHACPLQPGVLVRPAGHPGERPAAHTQLGMPCCCASSTARPAAWPAVLQAGRAWREAALRRPQAHPSSRQVQALPCPAIQQLAAVHATIRCLLQGMHPRPNADHANTQTWREALGEGGPPLVSAGRRGWCFLPVQALTAACRALTRRAAPPSPWLWAASQSSWTPCSATRSWPRQALPAAVALRPLSLLAPHLHPRASMPCPWRLAGSSGTASSILADMTPSLPFTPFRQGCRAAGVLLCAHPCPCPHNRPCRWWPWQQMAACRRQPACSCVPTLAPAPTTARAGGGHGSRWQPAAKHPAAADRRQTRDAAHVPLVRGAGEAAAFGCVCVFLGGGGGG